MAVIHEHEETSGSNYGLLFIALIMALVLFMMFWLFGQGRFSGPTIQIPDKFDINVNQK